MQTHVLMQEDVCRERSGYAELLHNLRLRRPTDEEVLLLRSRVGAPLPNYVDAPIVVRRHQLRHAFNVKKIQAASSSTENSITYCMAKVKKRVGMSLNYTYSLRHGHDNVRGDVILPLLPRTRLQITQTLMFLLVTSIILVKFLTTV